jgi:hypothetical protein
MTASVEHALLDFNRLVFLENSEIESATTK